MACLLTDVGSTFIKYSVYDESTQNAIKIFQRKNLLNDTGIIDANTFNRLADAYEEINSRGQ